LTNSEIYDIIYLVRVREKRKLYPLLNERSVVTKIALYISIVSTLFLKKTTLLGGIIKHELDTKRK